LNEFSDPMLPTSMPVASMTTKVSLSRSFGPGRSRRSSVGSIRTVLAKPQQRCENPSMSR
jgi:hypothetical protein